MTRPISTRSSVGFAILAATFAISTAAYAQQAPAKPLGPPQAGDRLSRLSSLPFPDAPSESPSLDGPLRVVPFVKGLVKIVFATETLALGKAGCGTSRFTRALPTISWSI